MCALMCMFCIVRVCRVCIYYLYLIEPADTTTARTNTVSVKLQCSHSSDYCLRGGVLNPYRDGRQPGFHCEFQNLHI